MEWIADTIQWIALCVSIENVVLSEGSETLEVMWFLLHKMSLKGWIKKIKGWIMENFGREMAAF